MAIPLHLAEKIGLYDLMVHNTMIKVRVADDPNMVSLGLSELIIKMGNNKIVGIIAQQQSDRGSDTLSIVLCVKSNCLIVQVGRLESIPESLCDFLKDKGYFFVGSDMKTTLHRLTKYEREFTRGESCYEAFYFPSSRGMDVGDLAAKILLDPNLLSEKWIASKPISEHLQSIANKAGVNLEKTRSSCVDLINLVAPAFSRDELKHLVSDVYASYLIADTLLDSL